MDQVNSGRVAMPYLTELLLHEALHGVTDPGTGYPYSHPEDGSASSRYPYPDTHFNNTMYGETPCVSQP